MRFKFLPHYFSTHLNREVTEVYWFTIISNFAISMVYIFEPIYLYTLGYSLSKIMWFYVIVYVAYMIFISFGAKFAGRYGYKHAIFLANIFFAAYWLSLFGIKYHPTLFFIAPLFFALQKSMLWPAYQADIALNSVQQQRGREVGVLISLVQIAFIGGPLVGGLISESFGFKFLFITASVLILLSTYPLFASKEIYSPHVFKFKNLLKMFKKYPTNFFGYWGFAEDMMLMSLWPIYMFVVVGNFQSLGFISTIATVVGTVIMLYVGKIIDQRGGRHTLIFEASIVYAATWFMRFAAQGVALVLGFDILTKTAKNILDVPMISLTYENASIDGPDHAIAYCVFFEFSLAFGKVLTCLASIAILTLTNNIYLVFGLVGILTMFYGLLRKHA